ncbi:hypothetical protein CLV56_1096 [Mumia flava]|uniref:Uncharacterized protein n=1 Tax=Mumia flava TaxID=1348852 RepID=A0A0B2BSD2_9ACTN|nr:hypothetical protein [Mumia flava]PJJ56881.1 hypothetical protein CLV56_1096 [Mumia flava]
MHLSNAAKWIGVVVLVAAFVISGITVLLLAQNGVLPSHPWQEVGTALAIFGAVSALIAGIAEADVGSHQTRHTH